MSSDWSSDWYKDRFSDNDHCYPPCLHRHVVTVSMGNRRFSQGEVTDDIQERLQCLDCLEYVSEEEVRTAWNGESADFQSGGEDDNF